jgi:hypothetical protein
MQVKITIGRDGAQARDDDDSSFPAATVAAGDEAGSRPVRAR